jgi:hypothetical protein
MLEKTATLYLNSPIPHKTISGRTTEPARRTAGTLKISAEYTNSVRVLRAAVRANHAAGRGNVARQRADDVSCEIIDIVPGLDQAARRTLRLVAGQLKRACAGPRPRNGNGHHSTD